MTVKAKLAHWVAKSSQVLLKKLTSGGSSLPGKIAKKIDPNILSELAKDYEVVIITGTNGKTVTTALTVNLLKESGMYVLTNDTGSNMEQGIISTFISAKSSPYNQKKMAVLEVDEASLRHVTTYIKPTLIVVTNIFRDQMDRYGEIYTTYDFILEGAKKSPESILLMNGDAPIFSSKETINPRQYFGFYNDDKKVDRLAHYNTDGVLCPKCEHVLHYHKITYSNLGDFFCVNCGFKRPPLIHSVTEITTLTTESAGFAIDDNYFDIPVAGLYNIYNALAAYSVARHFDLSVDHIKEGFKKTKRIFGRQEALSIGDKDVRINLIKNPVGFNQIVELIKLEPDELTLFAILNDNPADGEDVSWIWDGNFEELAKLKTIKESFSSGIRESELNQRMRVAGFDDAHLHSITDVEALITQIQQASTQKVYILATYTAMLELRKVLANQGYVKERMHT